MSIDQWCATIGLFGVHRYVAIIKQKILKYSNLKALIIFLFFYSTMFLLLLVQHGDIEITRGTRKSNQNISRVVIGMLTVY